MDIVSVRDRWFKVEWRKEKGGNLMNEFFYGAVDVRCLSDGLNQID